MLKRILEKAQKENKKIKIIAHKKPDGDAVASSKTLERFFKENGIDAKYIVTSRPNNAYVPLLGYTEQSKDFDKSECISIILDTSTLAHAENTSYRSSRPEDIYIFDHHEKPVGTPSIEEDLHLPKENIFRNPKFSSTCEILGKELHYMKALNPDLSTMLLVGMCTDTASFRHLKPSTFENLKLLLKTGGNLSRVQGILNKRRPLKSEVGLAKAFLGVQRIKVGNTYINYLGLDNKQVKELQEKYGISAIPKKIFKLANIEDTSINMVIAEEAPNKYECEFRSISFCGDIDVFSIANNHGGGGHHNASGCTIPSQDSISTISRKLLEELTTSSLEKLHDFTPDPKTENDKKLSNLLTRIDYFRRTPKIQDIDYIQNLLKSGVNYTRTYENLISFKKFMLRNEILSHIPDDQLESSKLSLTFDKDFLEKMKLKYDATPQDLFSATDIFKELAVESTTIHIAGQKPIILDKFGRAKSSVK